jgi:oligopeptide transport system substrate-binding protein
MTTKVIEIRLTRPQPHFLDLLAHPALALRRRDRGWGPLRQTRSGRSFVLTMAPDPAMIDAAETGEAAGDPIAILWGSRPAAALAQFDEGEAGAVFGGRFEHWPYLAAAGIEGAVIRRDPVDGLFGLAVVGRDGLLAQNLGRDAVAMAIDRAALVEALGVPEWAGRATLRSPRLAPGQRPGALPEPIYPAWIDLSFAERRARARDIVRAISANLDGPVRVRIALPEGPGAGIMFARLRGDFTAVGITAVRVPLRADADLRLIDEVSPSDDPLWYLRRVGCQRGIVCDPDNENLITAMTEAPDATARSAAVARADEALTRFGAYIPLASPLRWSLATPRLTGHRPNLRGQHNIIRLLPPPD